MSLCADKWWHPFFPLSSYMAIIIFLLGMAIFNTMWHIRLDVSTICLGLAARWLQISWLFSTFVPLFIDFLVLVYFQHYFFAVFSFSSLYGFNLMHKLRILKRVEWNVVWLSVTIYVAGGPKCQLFLRFFFVVMKV